MAKMKFALPTLPTLPTLPVLNLGAKLWHFFVEGSAPDRRNYDVCYFPLVHKNADNTLIYFGAFVPDLYELARAKGRNTPFQDAILLPKKDYAVNQKNGKLLDENDLRHIGAQVSKVRFTLAQNARAQSDNLNFYSVDRMPAKNLYFNQKSGIAQSIGDAQAGDLINVYGGARQAAYHLAHINPTNREHLLHAGLNWMGRTVAAIAGVGAGLAFLPVAPAAGLLAGLATYYVVTSVKQFDFWDKAEALIKHNWMSSSKHRAAKKLDVLKLAKTAIIAAMVGFVMIEGSIGAYVGMVDVLTKLPYFAGMIATAPKALLGIKAFVGLLATTAALGGFRGLMSVMHQYLGLGYAKTAITPEERAALPVQEMLAKNQQADLDYKTNPKNAQVARLTEELKQAQNPCVSKVLTLQAVFDELIEQGKISKAVLSNDEAFDNIFKAVTNSLPMSLGAWAPAQVFNDLTQAEKMAAIADFKKKGRFTEYKNSVAYQDYLGSDRYKLDRDSLRAFLQGKTYQLDAPAGDCCCANRETAAEPVQFSAGGRQAARRAATQQPMRVETSSTRVQPVRACK